MIWDVKILRDNKGLMRGVGKERVGWKLHVNTVLMYIILNKLNIKETYKSSLLRQL